MGGDGSGRVSAVLLGLPGFVVLSAAERAGEAELLVETPPAVTGCPGAGGRWVARAAGGHGAGSAVGWAAGGAGLAQAVVALRGASVPEAHLVGDLRADPAAGGADRTGRRAAMRRVQADQTVTAVTGDFLVGWHPVMRAVIDYGQLLVDDPDRLAGVAALGVDEHVWTPASPSRRTGYGPASSTSPPAGLLDVVPGRSGTVYADWIAEREQQRRAQIRIAALDPFRGYATALAATLPEATRVLDAFHIVALANKMVNETRQRIQQDTLGHPGRKGNPLSKIRRLLRRGIKTPSDAQRRQVNLGLQVGDPTYAVTVA